MRGETGGVFGGYLCCDRISISRCCKKYNREFYRGDWRKKIENKTDMVVWGEIILLYWGGYYLNKGKMYEER